MKSADAFVKAMTKISAEFESMRQRVFTLAEIAKIFTAKRQQWRLGDTTQHDFILTLTKGGALRQIKLDFPYRAVVRYTWGRVSTFDLLQSINPKAYFSHYTAMHLHALTEQIPKTIYLNIEQPKRPGGGTLAQDAIDRSFKSKCRVSTNAVQYEDRTVCLLNGANTGQLGVTEIASPEGSSRIRVTNIERTIIDAAVRPIYSGGIYEVAKAFEAARDLVSANKLAAYLRKIGYTYPYHQSVGYYMQRAKYKPAQLALIREFGREFDFYLDYQMKKTDYNAEWCLYVPHGF